MVDEFVGFKYRSVLRDGGVCLFNPVARSVKDNYLSSFNLKVLSIKFRQGQKEGVLDSKIKIYRIETDEKLAEKHITVPDQYRV